MNGAALRYRLADVFAARPYQGNGVAVLVDPPDLTCDQLQAITVEVRQFESAFLWRTPDPTVFQTRIFVVTESWTSPVTPFSAQQPSCTNDSSLPTQAATATSRANSTGSFDSDTGTSRSAASQFRAEASTSA